MGKIEHIRDVEPNLAANKRADIFSHLNIGENLSNNTWREELHGLSRKKTFKSGTTICAQGRMVNQIGFVLLGTASSISLSENGCETWLGQFSSGQFFAHTSYFSQAPLAFEIAAETDVTALMIRSSDIHKLLESSDGINKAIFRDLACRYNMMRSLFETYTSASIKQRVCTELIRTSKPVGINAKSLVVSPKPKVSGLARRLNVTRESVSRSMSELLRNGIISKEPGAIIINRPSELLCSRRNSTSF